MGHKCQKGAFDFLSPFRTLPQLKRFCNPFAENQERNFSFFYKQGKTKGQKKGRPVSGAAGELRFSDY
jgi:hypothetical protein